MQQKTVHQIKAVTIAVGPAGGEPHVLFGGYVGIPRTTPGQEAATRESRCGVGGVGGVVARVSPSVTQVHILPIFPLLMLPASRPPTPSLLVKYSPSPTQLLHHDVALK